MNDDHSMKPVDFKSKKYFLFQILFADAKEYDETLPVYPYLSDIARAPG